MHAAGVTTLKPGVCVVGIGLDALVRELNRGVIEVLDPLLFSWRHMDVLTLVGEEGVVRIVGGIEQVLVVELAEDVGHQQVVVGHGVFGVGLQNDFHARDRTVEVHDVEVLVGVANLRRQVERIGMQHGLSKAWRSRQHRDQTKRQNEPVEPYELRERDQVTSASKIASSSYLLDAGTIAYDKMRITQV